MNLLFLGDSITDCSHDFDPQNLGDGYVRMIFEQLAPRIPGLSVFNRGIDGFTVPRVYEMWKRLPETRKESFDIVTILVGVNDVGVWMAGEEALPAAPVSGDLSRLPAQNRALTEFARTYEDLAADILDYGIPRIILMEPFIFSRPPKYLLWRPLLAEVSARIREISENYRLDFLPLQDALDTAANAQGYDALTLDGIHLTERGNRLLAREWIRCAGF